VSGVQTAALLLVAVLGTGVALVRHPLRQLVVAGVFGLALAILFFAFQAPDVALSQIVVGSVALPILVLLTLAKLRDLEERDE
jgi:energy-converting hydrogenase B subunit D